MAIAQAAGTRGLIILAYLEAHLIRTQKTGDSLLFVAYPARHAQHAARQTVR